MVIHYPPARLRHNSDQPTAITNVLVATSGSSHQTRDISLGHPDLLGPHPPGPLGAVYPSGDQVVVVWPGGALTGPPGEVAGELDQLGGDGHDDLERSGSQPARRANIGPADPAARPQPAADPSTSRLSTPQPRKPASAATTAGRCCRQVGSMPNREREPTT
jgi:hypothetical protein